jgi:4-hydroxy-tetrahydrodipicolinate synthase
MFRGSIVALVTPMAESGEVDYAASPTITAAESDELLRRAVRRLGGRLPVIAGTGTNSTATTVERTRRACEHGVDGVLIVTPYYNKPGQEGLVQHFSAAADASSVPVILYNVPSRTACDLLPPAVERLSEHPRIVGVKEATGQLTRAREILERCGDDFLILSGDDASCRELMLAGAQGVISVTANAAPRLMHELCDAALEGDASGALLVDQRLELLHRDLFVEANPIPVKWSVARLGLIPPGIRLPLTPLETRHHAVVLAAMKHAQII